MDIRELKERICEDYEVIKDILEYIGCDRVTLHNKEYRCAKNPYDTNPTRVVVKFDDNISSRIYDLIPIKGDIFTTIMELKTCKLNDAIKICCKAMKIEYKGNKNIKTKTRKKAFGGFFSNVKTINNNACDSHLNKYNDDILNSYINKGNIRMYKDGINYEVQTEFDIMYDAETNRITVPWRDLNGNIVGIMGRYNDDAEQCNKLNISKWLPLPNLQFPKSQLLYGLYQNYKYILQEGRVYVGESEKFVLQARSFGIYNTVAIGSHDISDIQRGLLLMLRVDIVTCMDEDIPDEFNVRQCQRLKSKSTLVGGKVGFTMNDGILNQKESPTDRGLEVFLECIKEDNIFWV